MNASFRLGQLLISFYCGCRRRRCSPNTATLMVLRLTPTLRTHRVVRYVKLRKIAQKIICNTTQYNTIQFNTIQYNTIQYNTIQFNTIQYNLIQYNTIQYNLIQYKMKIIQYIPLIMQVRGPYGKLWTEFFPSFYGPSAKHASHENKEGKNEDP